MAARMTLVALTAVALAAAVACDQRGALHVRAIQRAGWWEVRYADGTIAANELHVPAGRRTVVDMTLDRAGVLWLDDGHLPRIGLHAAIAFSGSRTKTSIVASIHLEQPRRADLLIVPDDRFDVWLAHQKSGASAPRSALVSRGRSIFLTARCTLCHSVRGIGVAEQSVAPDLTHFASRRSLAAGVLPNRIGDLAGWIVDPETLKPGSGMPVNNIGSGDLESLLAFLRTLQ